MRRSTVRAGAFARSSGSATTTPIVLYTGTFESYQGLDLLFAAARHVLASRPDVRFVLAGGRPEQIEIARPAGCGGAGGFGASCLPVSVRQKRFPRSSTRPACWCRRAARGTNTPLKIYQYLRSGRPIVATRLLTHTQVLDDDVAVLTSADGGSVRRRHSGGARRSRRARDRSPVRHGELADTKYSYEAYLARTRQACAYLDPRLGAPGRRGVA